MTTVPLEKGEDLTLSEKQMIAVGAGKAYIMANYPNDPLLKHIAVTMLEQLPKVEAIPVSVMEREISGICAADQCDQAGRYDFQLRHALEIVLEWYNSPRYKEMVNRG